MRGKRYLPKLYEFQAGITPACAGKTHNSALYSLSVQDHPRVCGENLWAELEVYIGRGSPPRVRGKRTHRVYYLTKDRITPACAGKTPLRQRKRPSRKDHPRVCGENFPTVPSLAVSSGSPPRVRGKPALSAAMSSSSRITPACAGKTQFRCLKKGFRKDHPRVCGENVFARSQSSPGRGSPPRVRGKPQQSNTERSRRGITPACAGKTETSRLSRQR